MNEVNECYGKLMEYVSCIDRCVNLSANNKRLARLTQFKNPNLNEMESRILVSVCRDLNPLTLEGKCLLESKKPKITRYEFKKPEDIKDEIFTGNPVVYASNKYTVKEVCLYNQKWLKEYYNDPYELLSKAGTNKTQQMELIGKQKLKKEKREAKRAGTVVPKGIVPPIRTTNLGKNHSNPSSNTSTPAFIKRNKKNDNKESTPDRMKEQKSQQQSEEQSEEQKQPSKSPPQQSQQGKPPLHNNITPNSTPVINERKTVLQQQQQQQQEQNLPTNVTVIKTPIQQPRQPPQVVITPTKQYTQQPPQQQQNNNNFRVLTTIEPIVTPTSSTAKKFNSNNNNNNNLNNNLNKEKPKAKIVINIKEPEKKEKFIWCCCEESKKEAYLYDCGRNLVTFCLLLVFITFLTLRFVKYMNYSSSLLQKYAIIGMFSLLGVVIEILELCINCCKIQSLHYMGYRIYSGVISLFYVLIAIYSMKCDSSLPYMCFFVMAFIHLFGMCWKKPSPKVV